MRIGKSRHPWLAIAACLLLSGLARPETVPADLSAEQIVAAMSQRDQQRKAALKEYFGQRHYEIVYKGFPAGKEAAMQVCASFAAPGTKTFSILSQSGSAFIINRVLKRLLESEQEATSREQQTGTALTDANYEFELLGHEMFEGRAAYVLHVSPKVDTKFLYRGKVWVDASDFAVMKIEAEPAKRPSFWISKTRILHVYTKVGSFWLPEENKSTTDVRMGGVATLTIEYSHYEVNQGHAPCAPQALARGDTQ